jgi:putative tryptophan/tyrosine transport system substrate-binding protein
MRQYVIGIPLCTMLFALCFPADAQQTGKVPRIGFLDSGTASGSAVLVEAFRQEMRKLGWIEGKNIAIEYRSAENKGTERLPELAADLVRLKVDLMVVAGGKRRWRQRKRLLPSLS